jgi:hypothetical protein
MVVPATRLVYWHPCRAARGGGHSVSLDQRWTLHQA